jgi:hypothetical protein
MGLERLLGGPFPSPDALLDFLAQFHDPACWAERPADKKAYVPPESAGLRALDAINRAVVERGADRAATRDIFQTMTPKYLAVVSNREPGTEPAALLRWHWEKAGTIEHVHRVGKDELGAGVMPSGRLGANAAWFRINALAFNVLTILKRRALPERLRDARPKRLRFELLTVPAKLVLHQSRLAVRASACEERLQEIVDARGRLLAMLQARRAS